jgi:hypothetical protein
MKKLPTEFHIMRRLYRARKLQQRPMTHLVADALEVYLAQHEGATSALEVLDRQQDVYAVTDRGREFMRRHRPAA